MVPVIKYTHIKHLVGRLDCVIPVTMSDFLLMGNKQCTVYCHYIATKCAHTHIS